MSSIPSNQSKRQAALAGIADSLAALAFVFSAVHLSTTQFLRTAFPAADIVIVPPRAIVLVVFAAQVIPTFVLYFADRTLFAVSPTRFFPKFRRTLIAISLILIIRQFTLYVRPAAFIAESAEKVSPLLAVLLALAATGLLVRFLLRWRAKIEAFYVYFAPVGIVLTLALIGQESAQNSRYDDYSSQDVFAANSTSAPVYVIVFDELSYDALLTGEGTIDRVRFPNFARLADDSLVFDNATANFFHTWLAVPALIDQLQPIDAAYNIRLYEQTNRIEKLYASTCGKAYTCRGQRFLSERDWPTLSAEIGLRGAYAAMPKWMEVSVGPVLHWVDNQFTFVPAPADRLGIHAQTRELLQLYLDDIRSGNSPGTIYFLHTLLPHNPFVFSADGEATDATGRAFNGAAGQEPDPSEFGEQWNYYLGQVAFADEFLGQLIEGLKGANRYDKSVIIITADHGLRPSYPAAEGLPEVTSLTTRVPLIVHAPGSTPGIRSVDYQHVDFGPTLYELLRQEVPEAVSEGFLVPVKGISALAEDRPVREKVFYVDYRRNAYWEYHYDQQAKAWRLTHSYQTPIGDRTAR